MADQARFARRVTALFAFSRRRPPSTILVNQPLEEMHDGPTNVQLPAVSVDKVISRSDAVECEQVLNALENDPDKVRKLGEMNEEGLTLIHCAARCDGTHAHFGECTRLQCLQWLIKIGADVKTPDRSEATILHHAIRCGCSQTIDYILLHHEDLVNSKDHHGNTPLHYAVQCTRKGMEKISQKLIEHGAGVNTQNEDDVTPLHLAAKLGNEDMIDLLLSKKADIHAVDKRKKHTPLLVAAANGRKDAIACLAEHLDKDNMNQVDGDGKSALFLTVEAGHDIAVNKIMALTRQTSSETDNLPCKASKTGDIPLHIAASRGNIHVVKSLLEKTPYCEHQIKAKNKAGKTPLHVAAENGVKKVVKILVRQHPTIIQYCEKDQSDTPLHLACANGHHRVVSYLLKVGAHLKAKNTRGETPFHQAAIHGHKELVAELADTNEDCVKWRDNVGRTALRCACDERCIEVMSTLLKKGSDIRSEDYSGVTAIEAAIERGHEDVVEAIIESDDWVEALRHTYPDKDQGNVHQNRTNGVHLNALMSIPLDKGVAQERREPGGHALTPLRKMIWKMPVVAAKVLNRCTLSGSNPKYSMDDTVVFDYQFLEDFRSEKRVRGTRQRYLKEEEEGQDKVDYPDGIDCPIVPEGDYKDEEGRYSKAKHLAAVTNRHKKKWQSTWGPINFRKSNHPLMTMVDAGRLDLLEHPLVGSLLHYKWKKFGMWTYLTNMFTYLLFVISLTTFALTVMTPDTGICRAVLNGTFCNNTTGDLQCGDCGISSSERHTIIAFAILTILMTAFRFGLEVLQMIQFKQWYLTDWTNWIELILFAFTIMFVCVFATPCLCPQNWQWQLGILAVFLAWIDLVLFVQKFPVIGIYIVMFLKICKTFLWTVVLSLLLIISFGLAFYMAFYEPQLKLTGRSRDTFSTPAYAIFKTMAMSTGEIDFDPNFHISRDGAEPELPFLPVTSILWIIFISVMPILFINMLTGLAVDDVKKILKDAELSKLALQVELVLSVEERMPKALQKLFGWGTRKWRRASIVRKTSTWQKAVHVIWGGKLYNLRENVEAVVNPHVLTVEDQTMVLLNEMKKIQAITEAASVKKDQKQNSKEDTAGLKLKEEEKKEDTWKEDMAAQLQQLRENSENINRELKNLMTAMVSMQSTSQLLMQDFIKKNVFQPLRTQIQEQNQKIDHMQQTLIGEQNRQIDHMQQTLILKQVEQRSQNEQLASHNQKLEERMIRLERLVRAMAQHQGLQVEDPEI